MKKKIISRLDFLTNRFILNLFVTFVALVSGGVIVFFQRKLWLGWALLGIAAMGVMIILIRNRQDTKILYGDVRDEQVATRDASKMKEESLPIDTWLIVIAVCLFMLGVGGVGAAAIIYSVLGEDLALQVVTVSLIVVVVAFFIGFLSLLIDVPKTK